MHNLILLYRLLGPGRRRHLLLTLAAMLAGALAEMVTIGAALSFLLLLSGASGAALPQRLVRLLESTGLDGILAASLILVAAALAAALFRLWLVWLTGRFAADVGVDMSTRIFSRTLRQPYASFVQRNSSEVLAGIAKVHMLVNGLILPVLQALVSLVIALAIGTLLVLINPLVAGVVLLLVGSAYGAVSVLTRKRLRRNAGTSSKKTTARTKIMNEGIGGIRDIILDQSQPYFERQFQSAEVQFRHSQTVTNFIAAAPRYVVEGAGIVALVVVALVMSRRPGGLAEAIPVIGALALGAQRLLPVLQQAYWGFTQARGSGALVKDVIELMEQPLAPVQPRPAAGEGPAFREAIAFETVSFAYGSGGFALRDVSIAIPRGSRLGVMGTTGSGKSTFLDLLMGLLDPSGGRILIDGQALDDRSRSAWQAQIAHVPQSIYLADATIAENVAFGIEGPIDYPRLHAAAKAACLSDFVETLSDGFETSLGERGIRLSGGQRQRIGLARALYKGAAVLVLDEATSALDDQTEAAVIEALAQLGDAVTVVMVAHRRSTLAGCDRIVRIDHGRLSAL